MRTLSQLTIASLLMLASSAALAGRMDRSQIWFGVEYSFQDQEMVNEPGRATLITPYKEQKARDMTQAIVRQMGLDPSIIVEKKTWKPGLFIQVPGDGQWVVNSEPVTIEVNTTPRTIDEIETTAEPVFKAAKEVGLVGHVNPGAERSGMGHVHVGARSMQTNPFFLHPRLLRNVMVYMHKHPAFMHGFAEVFDIGMNSNVETYHEEKRQNEFQAAVEEFDAKFATANQASSAERADGLNMFLAILKKHDQASGFFEHYRLINLEHLQRSLETPFVAADSGKFTTEFRGFRPPKDPQTAHAFAELLMAVFEKQSDPAHVEPFRRISHAEYNRFNTGSQVVDDWQKMRAELGINNMYLDAEIAEYEFAVHRYRHKVRSIEGAELFLAYSPKEFKGTVFELRIPFAGHAAPPVLNIRGQELDFAEVKVGQEKYWMTVIDTKELKINRHLLVAGLVKMNVTARVMTCPAVFKRAG